MSAFQISFVIVTFILAAIQLLSVIVIAAQLIKIQQDLSKFRKLFAGSFNAKSANNNN